MLTVREAAVRLERGMDWVYRLLWSGKLQATRVDGKWLIPSDAVEARIAARAPGGGHGVATN